MKKHTLAQLREENDALRKEILKIRDELEETRLIISMFRNIVDNSPDMIWAKDMNGKYIFANKTVCEKLLNAKDTEEPVGKDDMFFCKRERDSHPDIPDYHTFGEICEDSDKITIKNRAPKKFEEFGNVKNKFLFLDVFKAPLWDSEGKMIGTVGSGRDVTEEKKTEERIRRSEENYRNIFNVTNNAIFIYNKKTGLIIDVNTAAENIYGYSKEELIKMQAGTLGSGETPYTKQAAEEWLRETMETGPQKFQWLAKQKGGRTFWVEVELKSVIFNGVETVMSIIKDINEQKKAEEALRESEERYKNLIENIRDGVIVHSNKKIVYANPASMEIVGSGEPKEYFIGKDIECFIHPDSKDEVQKRVKQVYEKKTNVSLMEEKFVRTDGRIINTEVMASMIDYDGEPASLVVFRDITERKETEKKLKESESSYRGLFDNAIDSIYIQDENGVFLDVNDVTVKMYGYPKEFFIGKTPEALSAPGKNDMKMIKNCLIKAINGEPQQFEFWGIGKNGNIFPQLVRFSRGKFFGKNVIFTFSIDITEQKKAEEEKKKLEAHIQHSQKLESLGILAGGIAHDFNNLLTGILGNAGLARMELSPETPALKNIQNIELTAIRAADLCNQLLAYSGKGKFVIIPIYLNQVVLEMAKLLKTSIPKKVSIEFNLAKDIPATEADVSQIRQVIMNLIINSVDAIGNKNGIISISTGFENFNEDQLLDINLAGDIKPGRYVFMEISDNGSGMDEDTQKKIFDPFFSTKFIGRGLGLAAVLGIIRGHNGGIKVTSTSDRGTSIKVFFPETSKTAAKDIKTENNTKNWHSKGTILIADDEESIRRFAGAVMEKTGFRIITAVDGDDSIRTFKENRKNIDIVLLDMTMPGKNGIEVFNAIKKVVPGIKVILSSGYSQQDTIKRFTAKGLAGFLQKPYHPEELIKIVKDVMGNENK